MKVKIRIKKRYKILALTVIINLMIIVSFIIVKRNTITEKIKNVIISRLEPLLKTEKLNIQSLGMDFKYISIKNIEIKKDDISIKVDKIKVQYSMFKLFSKGINFKEWINNIEIDGFDIILHENKKISDKLPNKNNIKIDNSLIKNSFKIEQYKKILSSLSQFAYLETIKIKNVNFFLLDYSQLPIISSLSGTAKFNKLNNQVTMSMIGNLFSLKNENVLFNGYIDYKYMLSSFKVEVHKTIIPKIDKLVDKEILSLNNGEYSSKFTLEINKLGDNKVDLFGHINLFNLNIDYKDNELKLADLNSTISFYNGDIFFNKFLGKLQNIDFSIEGSVKNIFNPELDFYLIVDKLKKSEIDHNLNLFLPKNTFTKDLTFGDNNSLYLHAKGGGDEKYELDFDLYSKFFQYKDRSFNETSINGSIKDNFISLNKVNSLSGSNVFNVDGNYFFMGKEKNQYNLNYKISGALFSEFPQLFNSKLSKMSTIIEGSLIKNKSDGFSVKSKLNVYDFSTLNSDDNVFSADLSINEQGLLNIKAYDKDNNNLLLASMNLIKNKLYIYTEDFRFLLKNLEKNILEDDLLISKIVNTLFSKDKSLSLILDGDLNNYNIKLFEKGDKSFTLANIETNIKVNKDSTITTNFVYNPSVSNNLLSLPKVNFNVSYNIKNSDIEFSNFRINNLIDIGGSVKVNTKSLNLSGNLFHSRLDFSKLFNNELQTLFTSNTFLNIKFDGSIEKPYIDLYAKENDLKLNLLPSEENHNLMDMDENYLNADIQVHLEDKNLRIEKIILYNDTTKLFSLTGNIEEFKKYELSSFGTFNLRKLLALQDVKNISGNVEYKVDFKGNDISSDFILSNGIIKIWDLNIFGEKFKFAYSLFDGSTESGINIKEFKIIHDKYVNLIVNGHIPLSLYEPLEIDAFFYGNILQFLSDKVNILEDGTSINEGNISVRGSLKKPKLTNFELYFLDGTLRVKNITKLLKNITGKFILDENKFVKIIGFNSISEPDNNRIILNSYSNYKDFEDVIFPLGINLGSVTVSMPDGGITGRIPGFMKVDDFGIIKLKGFDKDKEFVVGKRDGDFTISGTAELENIALTWPLLLDEFGPRKPNKKMNNIFDYVDFDLLAVPISGNTYFYDRGESNKSIFEKILSSFSLGNATSLNNVLLHVDGQKGGVKIEGLYLNPEKFKLIGSANCSSGRVGFSALSFDIENASILFDDYRNSKGYIDPYLTGLGKTLLKSNNFDESNGFSSVEDFFLTLVSRDENDVIIDKRGGRVSNYSIDIIDSYGNSILNKENEEFDKIIDNKINDETSNTYLKLDTEDTVLSLFQNAIDRRVFDPLLSPLENAIGNFFGGYIKINPKVTGNIQRDWEIPKEDGIAYSFADYIIGSEVYISKYFNNYFGVTVNSKYIGEDDYTDILQREFGYQNKVSLDFRITNSVFTNIGYEQNTIEDETGPFIGLSMRYKFVNLQSEYRDNLDKYFGYNYKKNQLYREEEE